MNIETGEIKTNPSEEEMASGKWVSLTIGEVLEVKGVRCRLSHVNPGRRRITLTALGDARVPEPLSNVRRVVVKNPGKKA